MYVLYKPCVCLCVCVFVGHSKQSTKDFNHARLHYVGGGSGQFVGENKIEMTIRSQ